MVIDYKGIDMESLVAEAREINKIVRENQYDSVEEYLGAASFEELMELQRFLTEGGRLTKKEFREIFGIAFSDKMLGKLKTVTALSTSSLVNEVCLKRMLDGNSICAFCFSAATQNRYPELRGNLKKNYIVMNSVVIPAEYWPDVDNDMLRFESFGDSASWKHDANCFECARANSETYCALWSKNPNYTREAIKRGYEKPKNLRYIYSSPKVNTPEEIEELLREFPFIDSIFTVFDAQFIKEHNIDINCGARSCRKCERCYKGDCQYIREAIK